MQKSRWATKPEEEEAQKPSSTPVASEEGASSAPATESTSQPESQPVESPHTVPVRNSATTAFLVTIPYALGVLFLESKANLTIVYQHAIRARLRRPFNRPLRADRKYRRPLLRR